MLLASSALEWERARLGAAMFRRRGKAPFEQHVPLAQELHLTALCGGRAGSPCLHLDAAHREGMAWDYRAHRTNHRTHVVRGALPIGVAVEAWLTDRAGCHPVVVPCCSHPPR